MNIKINSLRNANAEVYYESTTNTYTYKGTISSGSSMDVSVDYYDPVWVLITPSSSSAYVSLTVTTNDSYSSYDYSAFVLAVTIPTVICGLYYIIIWVFLIIWFVSGTFVAHKAQNTNLLINYSNRPAQNQQVIYHQQPNSTVQSYQFCKYELMREKINFLLLNV